jgi:hypothetical protein
MDEISRAEATKRDGQASWSADATDLPSTDSSAHSRASVASIAKTLDRIRTSAAQ